MNKSLSRLLLFSIGITFLLFLAACNRQQPVESTPVHNVQNQDSIYLSKIDSLQRIVASRDTLVVDLFNLVTSIHDNMDEIQSKKLVFLRSVKDLTDDKLDAIKAQLKKYVREINVLVTENREYIAALQQLIDKYNLDMEHLNNTILSYEQELNLRNKEISLLEHQLKGKEFKISALEEMLASMNKEFEELGSTIKQQEEQLNTAWYCVANKKDLLNSALISKKGKVLSIDASLAHKMDIRKEREIPVHAKKISILTAHPVGSYQIIESNSTVEKIIITDPKEFWSISKYCVVQVRN